MAGITFTRVSDRIVKVNNNGIIMGFAIGGVNIFEHPYDDKIIITTAGSPQSFSNGPGDGQMFLVSEVTTPAHDGKTNLVDLLVTTIFN